MLTDTAMTMPATLTSSQERGSPNPPDGVGHHRNLRGRRTAGGLISGSLALLSDAGHMFTDILALALSLAAAIVSQREATAKQTFGYQRVEILVALANGVALIFVSLFICMRPSEATTPT